MVLEPMEKLKAQVEKRTGYPLVNDFTAGVKHASKEISNELEQANAELVEHWKELIRVRDLLNNRVDQLECELGEVKAERDRLKKEVEEFQEAVEAGSIHELDEELKHTREERDAQENAAAHWKKRAMHWEFEAESLEKQRDQFMKERDALTKKVEGYREALEISVDEEQRNQLITTLIENQNDLISALGVMTNLVNASVERLKSNE